MILHWSTQNMTPRVHDSCQNVPNPISVWQAAGVKRYTSEGCGDDVRVRFLRGRHSAVWLSVSLYGDELFSQSTRHSSVRTRACHRWEQANSPTAKLLSVTSCWWIITISELEGVNQTRFSLMVRIQMAEKWFCFGITTASRWFSGWFDVTELDSNYVSSK